MANGNNKYPTKETLENLKYELELRREIAKNAAKLNEATAEQQRAIAEAQAELSAQEVLDGLRKQETVLNAMGESLQKRVDLKNHEIEVNKALLQVALSAGDVDEAEIKRLQRKIEELEKARDAIKSSDEAASSLGKSLGSAFQMSGVRDYTAGLKEVAQSLKGGTASAGKFMKSMSGAVSTSFLNNMIQMVVTLVDTESAFRKATGASKEFAQGVTNTYAATRAYGVTAAEASSANMALYRTFTDFTMATEGTRMALTKHASVLAELGVSNQDFAASTQVATKMLGVSSAAMPEVSRDIATFAQEMNMDIGQMFQQLGAAGPELAKFGNLGIDTFKRLQHASKITGLEMSKLLRITGKFDTFEGAAKQAGMLNAAIGANAVSALDLMMTTDPIGRFEMLRDAILDTGLTFDDMTYYQRIFYTEAAGLSDVSELAMMMSGNMDSLAGATQKTAKEYEDLAAQAQQVQSLQDQFNAVMAAATPILIPLMKGLKTFFNILSANEWIMKAVLAFFVSFKVAMFALGPAAAVAAPAAGGVAAAIGILGTAAAGAALPLMGLGAAMLMIGGGMALAGKSTADTFKAIASIGDLSAASQMIRDITTEIEKIPEAKAISLAVAMESIATVSKAVESEATQKNIRGAVAAGTAAATAGGARGAAGVTQVNQPIILQVGDNEMADFVIEAMGAEFIKFKLSQ